MRGYLELVIIIVAPIMSEERISQRMTEAQDDGHNVEVQSTSVAPKKTDGGSKKSQADTRVITNAGVLPLGEAQEWDHQ